MQLVQPLGSRPPSPRVRGEGRGEGASPQSSDSRQRPLTRIVPLRSSSDLSPRSGRGEKSKSALAARARPSSADAKGKKALRHDLVRSGRRWDRRRHDHAQQNPIRRRMSICSPDEAQRNPGTIARLATPTPDFTSFIRATKGKGGGTPADAYLQPPRPRLHPLPLAGGGQRRGRGARPRRQVNASRRTQNPRDAPPVGVPPRRLLQRANAAAQLRTRFLGRGVSCPSPASSSQAGHSAGRALLRSRPGAQVTSPRPREPHPLRRPVSPADVLRKRDSVQKVT